MLIVPLQAVASQTVSVILNQQACTINVYQKTVTTNTVIPSVYLDLYVNGVLIIGGVVCENLNVIVRDAYLGFIGDLAFLDTQGSDDPYYTGIGTRWFLAYYFPSELPSNLT
jgi:hypothetical protein